MKNIAYYVHIQNDMVIAKSKVSEALKEFPEHMLLIDEDTFDSIILPTKIIRTETGITFINIKMDDPVIEKDYSILISGLEQIVMRLIDDKIPLELIQPLDMVNDGADDMRKKINEILMVLQGGKAI